MGNQLKQLNIHHVINLVALVMSVDEQIRPHITKAIGDASSSKPLVYNGSRLGEVGDLEPQSLNFSTNFK